MAIDYPNDESRRKFTLRKERGEIPANARIGGSIGIHGTWSHEDFVVDRYKNWTMGCISMKCGDVEEIYNFTRIGTRVIIQNKLGETNQTLFDVENGALTVEAKVKFNKNSSGNYSYSFPPILSKTTARTGSTAGWSIFKNGNGFTAYLANGADNIQLGGSTVGVINDDLWHTIAMVMYRDGVTFRVEFYKDGDLAASGNKDLVGSITSTAPVTIGFNPEVFSTAYMDMQMTDVRIWKTRLLAPTINKYDCFDQIPRDHPNYASLVGHWSTVKAKLNTTTNAFEDITGNGRVGLINAANGGTVQWTKFDEISQNLCPTGHEGYYKIVPNNIDISLQVMQWIGINTSTYNLKGRSWITNYINL